MKAEQWIKKLGLSPHPEGGFYKEVYRDEAKLSQEAWQNAFSGERNISTAIYYLLQEGDYSCFHRIKSDELWHHYAGGTALIRYFEKGDLHTLKLGLNIDQGESPMVIIPKNVWFAAELEPETSYALMGCTVAPGFDFADFEKASIQDLKEYIDKYPDTIERLV
jgi:predicted cupin superfamily sugar epimerase